MKKRIRIQIIGDNLDRIRYPLNRAGIYTENLLQEGNPLGFVSLNDDAEDFFPCTIREIDNVATQMTIKKNLDAFLSHDPDKFCANKLKNGSGKTVRYNNTSSYVIVCNTNLAYPLLSYNGRVYADTGSRALREYLWQNGAKDVTPCSLLTELKNYFDRYIGILQKEYDSKHIILIKTYPSPWYMEVSTVKPFDDKTQNLRKLLAEADQYFVQRTGCVVVDTFSGAVPNGLVKSGLPCAIYPRFMIDELAAEIIEIIHSVEEDLYACAGQVTGTEFRTKKELYGWDTCFKEEEKFIRFLLRRNQDQSDLTNEDVRYIMYYVEQGTLNLHTILGIYLLADQFSDKHALKKVAACILHNRNCAAVIRSFARYEKNKVFLDSYPYFRGDIPKEEQHCAFLKINSQYILAISPEKDKPFRLIPFESKETVDEQQVIDSGYCCDIHEAEALCGSLKFYVQRAKTGNGNKPIKLRYETRELFFQSLFALDYTYLLQNEPFLIGIKRKEVKEFAVRTDLTFLFRKKTRCVRLTCGLADQIGEYVMGTCVRLMGGDVFYDDLTVRSIDSDHMGYELDKVIKENIENKCFYHILSDELLKSFDGREWALADELFESGVYHLIGVAYEFIDNWYSSIFKKAPVVIYKSKGDNIVAWLKGCEPLLAWYNWCPSWLEILNMFPVRPDQLIQFLPFSDEDERNICLMEEMEQFPGIGVHIRRGDYQDFQGETDQDYYREAIRDVLSIPEYSKAKVYVFSDDIPWCRKHVTGLGLTSDICGKVTFIDHNKGEDSFRDMQLLSLCRVIISQQGGFSRVAYLISHRSEMFFTPYESLLTLFKKIGRGNKYELHLEGLRNCIDPWKEKGKQRIKEEEDSKKAYKKQCEYIKYYTTLRVDIRNKGDKNSNVIEQSVNPAPVSLHRPNWLKDGITIEAISGKMTVVLQCRGNGTMEISLLGRDVRNAAGKRYPVWIDCTYFSVNGETVFSDTKTVCHDKRYIYRKTVTDGEIVKFDVAWSECNSSGVLDEYRRLEQAKTKAEKRLKKAKTEMEKTKRELKNVKNGWSFKVGRAVTYVPRKLRNLMKS